MKHVSSFHGAVTSLLTRQGYDSSVILDACNAYRGSIKALEADVTSETKLAGKVTAKGDDKRTLAFKDKEITKASKVSYAAPGALLALSDELKRVTERHGATVTLESFPYEIAAWIDRDSFRMVQGPEEAPKSKAGKVAA